MQNEGVQGGAWKSFVAIASDYGFSSLCMGEVPSSYSAIKNAMFFSAGNGDWVLHYACRKYQLIDPNVHALKMSPKTVFHWADLLKVASRQSAANKMYSEAREAFGIDDALIVSTITPAYTLGFVWLGAQQPVFDSLSRRDCLELACLARLSCRRESITSLSQTEALELPNLTQRQFEILSQIMLAKSNIQIADTLGLSEAGVDAQITSLFKAFRINGSVGNKRVALAITALKHGYEPPNSVTII